MNCLVPVTFRNLTWTKNLPKPLLVKEGSCWDRRLSKQGSAWDLRLTKEDSCCGGKRVGRVEVGFVWVRFFRRNLVCDSAGGEKWVRLVN